tara:strand:- start:2077 stop:3366 length:1290 start_codon:yes stop_codon:yes gene_type:complete
MNYPFRKVNFGPTHSDIPCDAFIYKFTHFPTLKWYIGMHGLKENEGPQDGSYWNSSSDDEFKRLLETEAHNFDYEITHCGSMQEMFKLENEILTELNAAADPLSWNKWNGFVYNTPELPRIDFIDALAAQVYDKNSGLERTIENVQKLLHKIIKLQVRFNTAMSHKKISEYRNEMDANNSTENFILTIVRKNGKYILVGGNHTLKAAELSKKKNIEVVWITEDLTMEEMHTLGLALNRKTEVSRMITEIEDCADGLISLYNDKKLTDPTFKDSFSTEYIKVTGGFKGHDIAKVRKIAREFMAEKASWKNGKKWTNWKLKIRTKERTELAAAITTDSVLCTTQSSTFRTDRVQETWIKDTDARESVGMNPRPNIKIMMHYPTQTDFAAYNKNGERKTHQRILESFLKGEGIKNPLIIFEDLEQWEDRISS